MKSIFDFRLRNATLAGKCMIAGFLLALGLAYMYAIANIALVVGWTPRDVAIHYYGAEQVVDVEKELVPSGEESLDLNELDSVPRDQLGLRPSFKSLVQEGHFHLFGMTSFFFGLTLLGLFTNLGSKRKAFLVGIPYIAIIFDNLSFMATRFLGPDFAFITALSGAIMAVSFTALWFAIGIELLQRSDCP